MLRFIRYEIVVSGLLALVAALALAGAAGAQDEDGLVPSFGDGQLVILGAGFKAGERVALTVDIDGLVSRFTTTADGQGRFRLATGLAVRPGAAVKLEARGDQGTAKAAITGAPGPGQPPGLPDTGLGGGAGPRTYQIVAVAGAGLVLASAWLKLRSGRRVRR